MKRYSRNKLIELCQRAVVPCTRWHDRDSYCAQRSVQSIYEGLTAGLKFHAYESEDGETIYVRFKQPIDIDKLRTKGLYLNIDSLENYWDECDPNFETEMFDGSGIDFRSSYTESYMPSEKRLDRVEGDDWY